MAAVLEHARQVGGTDDRGQLVDEPLVGQPEHPALEVPDLRTHPLELSRSEQGHLVPLVAQPIHSSQHVDDPLVGSRRPAEQKQAVRLRHPEAAPGLGPLVTLRIEDPLVPGMGDDDAAVALLERHVGDGQLVGLPDEPVAGAGPGSLEREGELETPLPPLELIETETVLFTEEGQFVVVHVEDEGAVPRLLGQDAQGERGQTGLGDPDGIGVDAAGHLLHAAEVRREGMPVE